MDALAQPAAKVETDPRLTKKQLRYCEEYLLDLNGTQAARRAGYATNSASAASVRLKRSKLVQAHIAKLQNARAGRLDLTPDMVLQALWREATTAQNGSTSPGRVQALKLVGDHLGMWRQDESTARTLGEFLAGLAGEDRAGRTVGARLVASQSDQPKRALPELTVGARDVS